MATIRRFPGVDIEQIWLRVASRTLSGTLVKHIDGRRDPDNPTSGMSGGTRHYSCGGIPKMQTDNRFDTTLTPGGEGEIIVFRGSIQNHDEGIRPEVNDSLIFDQQLFDIISVATDAAQVAFTCMVRYNPDPIAIGRLIIRGYLEHSSERRGYIAHSPTQRGYFIQDGG